MNSYAVIDFETTGLRAGTDRVIEVAAILVVDRKVVATFAELMDPGFRIPSYITYLTGISDAMVRGMAPPEAVMPRLRAFLGDHVCIAHNASFDQRFFMAEMERADERHERAFLCSMLLSRRLLPQAPNHKLGDLTRHLRLSTPAGMRAHRALADVLMTQELWQLLNLRLRARLNDRVPNLEILQSISKKPKAAVNGYLDSIAAGSLLSR